MKALDVCARTAACSRRGWRLMEGARVSGGKPVTVSAPAAAKAVIVRILDRHVGVSKVRGTRLSSD